MDWDWWNNFAPLFRDIGVGIGAIAGGIGAIPVINDWRKRKQKQHYRDKYIKRFSSHLKDKNDVLIWKLENSNKIYAIYKPDDTRQHIKSWSTYKELGYESGDWDKEVSKKVLNQYKEVEPIDFM